MSDLARWAGRDLRWLDELSGVWFNGGLTDEDREWLGDQLALAELPVPQTDTSWITLEQIR